MKCLCVVLSLRTGSFCDFTSFQEEHAIHDIEEDCIDDTHIVDLHDMPIVSETTGSTSIDRILLQHLLLCEFLLTSLFTMYIFCLPLLQVD